MVAKHTLGLTRPQALQRRAAAGQPQLQELHGSSSSTGTHTTALQRVQLRFGTCNYVTMQIASNITVQVTSQCVCIPT
jgi:hypothetical protein